MPRSLFTQVCILSQPPSRDPTPTSQLLTPHCHQLQIPSLMRKTKWTGGGIYDNHLCLELYHVSEVYCSILTNTIVSGNIREDFHFSHPLGQDLPNYYVLLSPLACFLLFSALCLTSLFIIYEQYWYRTGCSIEAVMVLYKIKDS